jgi:Zn-dependent membrane protease YugP
VETYKLWLIALSILLLLLIIVLNSRTRIVRTYNRYIRVDNKHNITGKQLAFFLKDRLQLNDLKFALTKHKLGDAYNYKYSTLIMSEQVCNTASLASLTIVAHELGHACQHKENSTLFGTTIFLTKLTRLTSVFILPLLITGLIFTYMKYPNEHLGYILIVISICLFVIHFLSKLLNIPLEYNASRRGLKFLKEYDVLSTSEYIRAKRLLSIAAQTYIASFFDEMFSFIKFKRKKK